MRNLFVILSTLFNTIPGIATFLKALKVPPGYKFIFSSTVEAFGVLSLLLLWVNRKKIKNMCSSKVTLWAIVLGIISFICICCYVWLLDLCLIHHVRGDVYFPIWLDGEIADMVSRAGGRYAAITKYGIDSVCKAIEQTGNSIAFTNIILLIVYQMIFTALGISFGLLGFHKKDIKLKNNGI